MIWKTISNKEFAINKNGTYTLSHKPLWEKARHGGLRNAGANQPYNTIVTTKAKKFRSIKDFIFIFIFIFILTTRLGE